MRLGCEENHFGVIHFILRCFNTKECKLPVYVSCPCHPPTPTPWGCWTLQWEKKKVNAVILAWFQILVLSLSGSVSFEKWFTALSLRFLIYKMRVTFRVMVKIVPTAIFWSSSSPKHLSPFPRIQSLRQSLYEYTLLKPQRCKSSGSKRRVKQKRRENESRKCVIKLAMASH